MILSNQRTVRRNMNSNHVQVLTLLAVDAKSKTTYEAGLGNIIECDTHTDEDNYTLNTDNEYVIESISLLSAAALLRR